MDLSNSFSGRITLDRQLSSGVTGSFSASATWQDRLDHPVSSSTEIGLDATLATKGPNGDHWQLGLSVARVTSDDAGIDHSEAELQLGWKTANPVAGLGLGASFSARVADYDASILGRHDHRLSGSVTATLQRLTYLGFSPVLSLDIARNVSNVALFDTETVGISLSVKSRF
jgi:Surface lipoprotein assembly modifier